jgi:Lysophospholipase L1 and related esterases
MRIVLMGDSITLGYNASSAGASWSGRLDKWLGENLKGEYELINSAVGSETAREGLVRIEDHVIKYTPDVVFIGYGTNDCTKEAGKYVNDFYNFESNMEDIAEAIRSQTNASIIFNLAPPVMEQLCNDGSVTIHNRDIRVYNDEVKRICGSMMLAFIDHFHILGSKENLNELIDVDGIHPTDLGHKTMFESILSSAGHFFR